MSVESYYEIKKLVYWYTMVHLGRFGVVLCYTASRYVLGYFRYSEAIWGLELHICLRILAMDRGLHAVGWSSSFLSLSYLPKQPVEVKKDPRSNFMLVLLKGDPSDSRKEAFEYTTRCRPTPPWCRPTLPGSLLTHQFSKPASFNEDSRIATLPLSFSRLLKTTNMHKPYIYDF